MKKLTFGDTFKLAKILKKVDLKEKLMKIFEQQSNSKEKGIDVAFELICAWATEDIEVEIYDFLNNVFEIEDVAALPISEFKELLSQFIKKNDLQNFFQSALTLM